MFIENKYKCNLNGNINELLFTIKFYFIRNKSTKKKEIIAYPTEAMFGIGCDPDSKIAVNRLLKIKKRSIKKGLILVAADFEQLQPYIDDSSITSAQWKIVFSAWPGPKTFIFPSKVTTPYWLTGRFNSLAVRVTNHELVIELCRKFGKPLVSTSANFAGCEPCRTIQEVYKQFGNVFSVINGKIGNYFNPSEINDVLTGKCIRKG